MEYIVLAIPIFFILIGIEILAMKFQEREVYRLNDSINDLSCGITDRILSALFGSLLLGGYIYLYNTYAVFEITPDSIAAWTILVMGVDFAYYWFHRCSHVINAAWAAHIVHHQSEEYNLSVALRQGAFQKFFSWIFYLPLAIVGFPPTMFVAVSAFNTLYQFWIHTRLIGSLGPIEWIFNTPSHHRVHHGRNLKYLDKNFGGTFIIWDRLFGSFQKEEEEPTYGITRPVNSWNPIWVQIHYWVELAKYAYHAPHWADKFKVWFMPPSWRPRGMEDVNCAKPLDPENYAKYGPKMPLGLNVYAFVHFAVVLYLSYFLFKENVSTQGQILLCSFIFVSMISLGGLFDKKKWAFNIEVLRLIAIPVLLLSFVYNPILPLLLIVAAMTLAFVFWVFRYRPLMA